MKGFTLTEVLISLFILALIGALGVRAFITAKTPKSLDVITDGLESTLGLAKSDAMSSKYNSNFGVFFASTTYTMFPGNSYSASNASNTVSYLPDGWKLATSTANGSSQVIFSRLSGAASTNVTLTVSNIADPKVNRQIKIGTAGNISVVK